MPSNIFLNLYKKIERLSSAVFLVSNTVSHSEELKTKIRHLVINLISHCAPIKDNTPVERIKLISNIEATLMELSSLLDIACLSGLVSEMNASILKQEFSVTLKNLDELRQYCNEGNKISNDFFNINNVDFGNGISINKLPIASINQKFIKDNGIGIKDKNNRKEHREKAIIDVIRARGNVNIKDISKSIKGCSEKTIQRKLISLIESGVVKKDGERRWSRYSLV